VSVSAVDTRTVRFTLTKPYAPFLGLTTLGILPAHLWQNIPTEEFSFASRNTDPIGSGPYQIQSITTDKTGAVTRYDLVPFKNFALGTPHLKKIMFLFFPNEKILIDAWNAARIDSFAGITPSELSRLNRDTRIVHPPLPRIFGVFFNQGHSPSLADASVRAALDAATDKQALVDAVLGGYAAIIDGPIPPGILENTNVSSDDNASISLAERTERARNILERGGWALDEETRVWEKGDQELTFALATADTPELVATAEMLTDMWRAAGILVDLQVYPISELNTNVIRPRSYDALLFGEVVGRTLDLFAFWHSSQRNDPGLNLALYTNAHTDNLLAQARATTNRKERETLYGSFVETITKGRPAVFLYTPQLIYVFPERIRGAEFGVLASPAERFLNVHEWYTDTERVWSIFTN